MSARRPHGQTYAEVAAKPPPESSSDVTPAVPSYVEVLNSTVIEEQQTDVLLCRDVIYKLLGFTAAMFALPIGMYFATVNAIFGGGVLLMIDKGDADPNRQRYLCWNHCGNHCQSGLICVHLCCVERGPGRQASSRKVQVEEGTVDLRSFVFGSSSPACIIAALRCLASYEDDTYHSDIDFNVIQIFHGIRTSSCLHLDMITFHLLGL